MRYALVARVNRTAKLSPHRNVMNYTIEETRNLGRNLPLSVMIGVPIVAVCYALVNISYFAVLSYDEILTAEAIALVYT